MLCVFRHRSIRTGRPDSFAVYRQPYPGLRVAARPVASRFFLGVDQTFVHMAIIGSSWIEEAMNHRELGQTGVKLPEVGLGTWEYQGGVDPLKRGVDCGAFLIDTAEGYGTEEIVGQAIRTVRKRIFLATKVSPQHLRRSDLLQAADKSLQRMRVDHIDLYQIHYPNYAVRMEETMAAMEELVDMGKVRFIGVSNFSVADLKRAQASLTKHRIVSNQVRYNLVDRSIEFGLLHYCRQNHITVIAHSPLARGITHIRDKDPRGTLSRVAVMAGKTEAQVALNWCTSKPGVIVIPKANSVEHTIENCHASGWRLADEQIELLEKWIKSRGRIEAALRQLARVIRNRFFWS
jgi:diketogulonate reductase-like aldo/keto reductase